MALDTQILSTCYTLQYNARQRLAGYWWALWNSRQRKLRFHTDIPPSSPHSVLIIMTGLIGDSVMCIPAIIQARKLWPDAKITLLGQKHNCELLSACPSLDVLYQTPHIPFSLRNRGGLKLLRNWLSSQHFDTAIILFGNHFALMLAEAGIPIRVGTKGDYLEGCMTHAYDAATPRTWGPTHRLNALRVLGYDVPDILPKLWVHAYAHKGAKNKLQALNFDIDRPYVVIHPFGSQRRQMWPIERIHDLAAALKHSYGMKSILVGNNDFKINASNDAGVSAIDARGAFTLQELLSLIERAKVVISTDSGPFHLAGALGRPIIGLFRSARPEHAQRYPTARAVFGQDASCNGHCRWDRCRSIPCRQLKGLTIDQVLEPLQDLRNIGSL
jgi:ADP-heptose:LPS heptosyltransferase